MAECMFLQFSYHKKLDKNYKVLTAEEYFKALEFNELTLVAIDADKPVGFIRGKYISEPSDRTESYASLQDIFVEPAHRNRNVGTLLCDFFFQKASDLGARNIELSVDVRNVQAKVFWEKLNFETIQLKMRRLL